MPRKGATIPDDLADIWLALGVVQVYGVSRSDWLLECLLAALRLIKSLKAEIATLKKG